MAENQSMRHIVIPSEDVDFHLYCTEDDVPPSLAESIGNIKSLLKEAGGNWKNIAGPYRYRIDGPHDATTGKRHISVYRKKKELFSLNWDGSPHDNSGGAVIPKKVFDYLIDKYPDLNLPSDRRISSLYGNGGMIKIAVSLALQLNDEEAKAHLSSAELLFEQWVLKHKEESDDVRH